MFQKVMHQNLEVTRLWKGSFKTLEVILLITNMVLTGLRVLCKVYFAILHHLFAVFSHIRYICVSSFMRLSYY